MNPLRWRLSLKPGHDGREEPEGFVNARLEELQLPQGAGLKVAACHLGHEKLVDLFLQSLVHFRVRCEVVEQAGKCCGRCVATGNYNQTCVSYQVFGLLPAWVRGLVVIFQYPVEDIRNMWFILNHQSTW